MNIKKYKYFTLEEIISSHDLQTAPFNAVPLVTLVDVYDEYIGVNNLYTTLENQYVEEMWQQMFVWFRKEYAIKVEEDADLMDAEAEFFSILCNKIADGYDYYTTILGIYANNKTKLMDKVKSIATGSTRFNDTPQNSGTFDTDPYTSNITQNEGTTESDLKTTMERIKEIQESYRDFLGQWAKSFRNIFIERRNI